MNERGAAIISTDRTTEILNYLSAISREVGAFRTETNERLDRIELEQRAQRQHILRIEGLLLTTRADTEELQDRVAVLERKQA